MSDDWEFGPGRKTHAYYNIRLLTAVIQLHNTSLTSHKNEKKETAKLIVNIHCPAIKTRHNVSFWQSDFHTFKHPKMFN